MEYVIQGRLAGLAETRFSSAQWWKSWHAGPLSVAAFTAMQCLMGTNFLFEYGTPDQHERLLKPAIRGEKVASFALTEADAATDLAGVKTTAAQGRRLLDHQWLEDVDY